MYNTALIAQLVPTRHNKTDNKAAKSKSHDHDEKKEEGSRHNHRHSNGNNGRARSKSATAAEIMATEAATPAMVSISSSSSNSMAATTSTNIRSNNRPPPSWPPPPPRRPAPPSASAPTTTSSTATATPTTAAIVVPPRPPPPPRLQTAAASIKTTSSPALLLPKSPSRPPFPPPSPGAAIRAHQQKRQQLRRRSRRRQEDQQQGLNDKDGNSGDNSSSSGNQFLCNESNSSSMQQTRRRQRSRRKSHETQETQRARGGHANNTKSKSSCSTTTDHLSKKSSNETSSSASLSIMSDSDDDNSLLNDSLFNLAQRMHQKRSHTDELMDSLCEILSSSKSIPRNKFSSFHSTTTSGAAGSAVSGSSRSGIGRGNNNAVNSQNVKEEVNRQSKRAEQIKEEEEEVNQADNNTKIMSASNHMESILDILSNTDALINNADVMLDILDIMGEDNGEDEEGNIHDSRGSKSLHTSKETGNNNSRNDKRSAKELTSIEAAIEERVYALLHDIHMENEVEDRVYDLLQQMSPSKQESKLKDDDARSQQGDSVGGRSRSRSRSRPRTSVNHFKSKQQPTTTMMNPYKDDNETQQQEIEKVRGHPPTRSRSQSRTRNLVDTNFKATRVIGNSLKVNNKGGNDAIFVGNGNDQETKETWQESKGVQGKIDSSSASSAAVVKAAAISNSQEVDSVNTHSQEETVSDSTNVHDSNNNSSVEQQSLDENMAPRYLREVEAAVQVYSSLYSSLQNIQNNDDSQQQQLRGKAAHENNSQNQEQQQSTIKSNVTREQQAAIEKRVHTLVQDNPLLQNCISRSQSQERGRVRIVSSSLNHFFTENNNESHQEQQQSEAAVKNERVSRSQSTERGRARISLNHPPQKQDSQQTNNNEREESSSRSTSKPHDWGDFNRHYQQTKMNNRSESRHSQEEKESRGKSSSDSQTMRRRGRSRTSSNHPEPKPSVKVVGSITREDDDPPKRAYSMNDVLNDSAGSLTIDSDCAGEDGIVQRTVTHDGTGSGSSSNDAVTSSSPSLGIKDGKSSSKSRSKSKLFPPPPPPPPRRNVSGNGSSTAINNKGKSKSFNESSNSNNRSIDVINNIRPPPPRRNASFGDGNASNNRNDEANSSKSSISMQYQQIHQSIQQTNEEKASSKQQPQTTSATEGTQTDQYSKQHVTRFYKQIQRKNSNGGPIFDPESVKEILGNGYDLSDDLGFFQQPSINSSNNEDSLSTFSSIKNSSDKKQNDDARSKSSEAVRQPSFDSQGKTSNIDRDLGSILEMADRMDISKENMLDDPSCIEGTDDAEYWKSVRGEKATSSGARRKIDKRKMIGSGRAINKLNSSLNNSKHDNSFGSSQGSEISQQGKGGGRDRSRQRHPPSSQRELPDYHKLQPTKRGSKNDLLAMADRMDHSHELSDPSVIEGASDDQYWKDVRGKRNKNYKRQMRGSGQAIRLPPQGSCGTSGKDSAGHPHHPSGKGKKKRSSSKKGEQLLSPSEQRKLAHENRKQLRLQERSNNDGMPKQIESGSCDRAPPSLAIRGNSFNSEGGSSYASGGDRSRGHHQPPQKKSSFFDRLKRGGKKKQQSGSTDRTSARGPNSDLRSSFISCTNSSARSLRSNTSDSRSTRSGSGSYRSDAQSASSNKSGRSYRSSKSVRSVISARSVASRLSIVSRSRSVSSRRSSRFSWISKSSVVGGNPKPPSHKRPIHSVELKKKGAVPSSPRRRHDDDCELENKRSTHNRQQQQHCSSSNASKSVCSSNNSQSEDASVFLSAAASLAEQQTDGVPLSINGHDHSTSVSFDDLSSCDSSSISSHSEDDYDDGGEAVYGSEDGVVVESVADAVQRLNKQNKLGRVAAAAGGLRHKMTRQKRSGTGAAAASPVDTLLQPSTRVPI